MSRWIAIAGVVAGCAAATVAVLGATGCGTSRSEASTAGTVSAAHRTPPGSGKPTVTVGDKNFTEQFVLGQLYVQALQANGFTVDVNQNIGPSEVTMQALQSGSLDMYPEYLDTWDGTIAGYRRPFHTFHTAYQAAQRYALSQGLQLLAPTPFGDTNAIVVGFNYAIKHHLSSIGDLGQIPAGVVIGGPLQFEQQPAGLPAIEQAYSFEPAAVKPLDVGAQYQALDQGTVQAASASSTDPQLISGNYTVLHDPKHVFGWGNVVPVVSAKVINAEGPAFAETINRVSALLTTEAMRQLNAAVDISHEDPAAVAKQFLLAHGLIRTSGR